MSDTMVNIKAALKYASTKKRLESISAILDVYDISMRGELTAVATLSGRS